MTQDQPVVQGLGQQARPLAGHRVCACCAPEVTAAAPYNGALESKLCIVQVCQETLFILHVGQLCDSTGQVVPQRLLGLPDSCRNNMFASNTLTPQTLFIHQKRRDMVVNQVRRQKTESGSLESVTEMWPALDMKSGYQSPSSCSRIYPECQLSPL